MKIVRRIALAIGLLATSMTVSAHCLSDYAHQVQVCEDTMGGFTEVGCKLDATGAYYGCVAHEALG